MATGPSNTVDDSILSTTPTMISSTTAAETSAATTTTNTTPTTTSTTSTTTSTSSTTTSTTSTTTSTATTTSTGFCADLGTTMTSITGTYAGVYKGTASFTSVYFGTNHYVTGPEMSTTITYTTGPAIAELATSCAQQVITVQDGSVPTGFNLFYNGTAEPPHWLCFIYGTDPSDSYNNTGIDLKCSYGFEETSALHLG
ncbi:hypothetical protein ANO11243_081450 [Dothideomycetidae sp. 11243]|nr:hypothetical protein ANO11243_081450 [fungal sp. No.11243]